MKYCLVFKTFLPTNDMKHNRYSVLSTQNFQITQIKLYRQKAY